MVGNAALLPTLLGFSDYEKMNIDLGFDKMACLNDIFKAC
jgi:hypothetical protein